MIYVYGIFFITSSNESAAYFFNFILLLLNPMMNYKGYSVDNQNARDKQK